MRISHTSHRYEPFSISSMKENCVRFFQLTTNNFYEWLLRVELFVRRI